MTVSREDAQRARRKAADDAAAKKQRATNGPEPGGKLGDPGAHEAKQNSAPCGLPAVDLNLVFAPEPPPATKWIIDELIPVGTSGLTSGPMSGGKSFLELIKSVCLASGSDFLGLFPVEQCPVLAYNSEDPPAEIIRRLHKICEALAIDAHIILRSGQLEIVSTVGKPLALFETDPKTNNATPTDWFWRTIERAKRNKARYLSFDHIGRYWDINHYKDNSQVYRAFTYSDQVAGQLDGAVNYLHHPNKDGAELAAMLDKVVPLQKLVSGAAALTNGPRFVHTLRWFRPGKDDEKFRLLQSYKATFVPRERAFKLVENARGIVEMVAELDPDKLAGKGSSKGGRPGKEVATFAAFQELVATRGSPVAIDDLVEEAIASGIVGEAEPDSAQWRDRRKTVRAHLAKFKTKVERQSDGGREWFAPLGDAGAGEIAS